MIQNDGISPDACELVGSISRAAAKDSGPPYDVAGAAVMCLPLDIVEIQSLSPTRINQWLQYRGISYYLDVLERELHGCLIAYRSTGLVFIDAADPVSERRYTIAHEVAHFIVDYWLPRQRAIGEFGASIQAVLDGHRPPRLEERLDSVFLQVTIKPYVCLLERSSHTPGRTEIWDSENRADQLAVQLLAPYREVCREVRAEGGSDGYFYCRSNAQRILTERFGLPDEIARGYARRIADKITGGMSAVEAWGL